MIYTTCNDQSDCSISFSYSISNCILIPACIAHTYTGRCESFSSNVCINGSAKDTPFVSTLIARFCN